jgi:hypothetical protein
VRRTEIDDKKVEEMMSSKRVATDLVIRVRPQEMKAVAVTVSSDGTDARRLKVQPKRGYERRS